MIILYFFATIDSQGNVTGYSDNMPLSEKELAHLVELAYHTKRSQGSLNPVSMNSYLFSKVVTNGSDITIVFTLSNAPELLNRHLFSVALSIFVWCLLLIIIASIVITNRTLKPIKKAWDRQIEFSADASHELRTPLSIIQLNLEVINAQPQASIQSQKKWIDGIYNECQNMAKLVEYLLLLSRTDSQQHQLDFELFDLDLALLEALQPMVDLASLNDNQLTLNRLPNTPFYGDRSLIKRLLIILVDNAMKYAGPSTTIDVTLKKNHHLLQIIVSDNGIGIESEHLAHIFDRFYRVDKSRSRNQGGSGLGLSIAKWIVDEHKGHIDVKSQAGLGTSFYIELPMP